jgi:DNA-directed RNA polymerase specialized sigma subunit
MFSKGLISEGQTATPEEGVQLPGTESLPASDIWLEYVHHDLDPIDKKILEWKTGMYGKQVLSTNEIARRLNITPSAVSQRAAKIAMKIEAGQSGR